MPRALAPAVSRNELQSACVQLLRNYMVLTPSPPPPTPPRSSYPPDIFYCFRQAAGWPLRRLL